MNLLGNFIGFGLLLYVFIPIGIVGWIIVGVKDLKIYSGPRKSQNFMLQDLLIIVLVYGFSILVFKNISINFSSRI